MARISRQDASKEYVSMLNNSRDVGETNDCAVKAVAIVTGAPYAKVHAMMADKGRKARKGTHRSTQRQVVEDLGFRVTKMSFPEMNAIIANYPGVHSTLQSITTHHPRRFPKTWARVSFNHTNLLLYSTNHVAAFVNGEVHDWSVNRALRVLEIWIVERKS